MKKLDTVNHEIIELLSCATARHRVETELERYLQDDKRALYYKEGKDEIIGCIGIEMQKNNFLEITHIAVGWNDRHQRVGSSMIDFVLDEYSPRLIYAVTDKEAVDFYDHYGFAIESLGEEYPGVERLLCVMISHELFLEFLE